MLACVEVCRSTRVSATAARGSVLARLWLCCGVLLPTWAIPAHAQSRLPEARLDVITGRSTSAQLGVAVTLGGAAYTRVALSAAAGRAWKHGESRGSARIDGVGRFHLDPTRASPWGLYFAGGVSGQYDGFERWRALLTTAIGLELPSRGKGVLAVELGLGGGVRVALALRRGRRDRR